MQLPVWLFPSPSFKKKTREKFHHPFQDTPPNKYGKMGYSTLGSGNREEKKRLVWSSASWSGSPWPPRCHPLLVGLRAPAVPQRFSAASSRQPRLRWAQGGMGRKEEGLGTEVPKAPAPGAGRGGFMVLFACSSSRQALPPDCPCLALLPLRCMHFGEQRLQLNAPCHLEGAWLWSCVGDDGR